jgi:hypothetical protein
MALPPLFLYPTPFSLISLKTHRKLSVKNKGLVFVFVIKGVLLLPEDKG